MFCAPRSRWSTLSSLGNLSAVDDRHVSRDEVLQALDRLLPHLEDAADEVRLVGAASSLLRGIELPVGDVDILARQRSTVDELAAIAAELGGQTLTASTWEESPWFGQYYGEFVLAGVRVGFSTVEVTPVHPIPVGECIRHWPWEHFDIVEVSSCRIPLVASELRLQSEVVRSRSVRWRPIGAHLPRVGWNEPLLATAEACVAETAPTSQPRRHWCGSKSLSVLAT